MKRLYLQFNDPRCRFIDSLWLGDEKCVASLSYAAKILLKVNFTPKRMNGVFLRSTEINECDVGPCKNNANCTDLLNDFNCSCLPGYTGKTCDIGEFPNIFAFKMALLPCSIL